MSRKQIKLHAQIGFTERELLESGFDNLRQAETLLAREVSVVCGGCATSLSTGWWREDGASHTPNFVGELHQEITINLDVSCEVPKEQRTIDSIKQACKFLKDKNLNIKWVHLSKQEFEGLHFEVEEDNLRRAI